MRNNHIDDLESATRFVYDEPCRQVGDQNRCFPQTVVSNKEERLQQKKFEIKFENIDTAAAKEVEASLMTVRKQSSEMGCSNLLDGGDITRHHSW